MGKKGIELLLSSFYIAMLSLILFNGVNFLAVRMFVDPLPELYVLWLVLTGLLLYIPLNFIPKSRKLTWLVVVLFLGNITLLFLYGFSFFAFVMTCSLAWFISKLGERPITQSNFTQLFVRSLFWFGIALLFTFPFSFSDPEVQNLVNFFILNLLLLMIGILLSTFRYSTDNHGHNFWSQWKLYTSYFIGGITGLGVLCIIPAFIIGFLFSILRVILMVVVSPFTWIINSAPALHEQIMEMWVKNGPIEGDEDFKMFHGVPDTVLKKVHEFTAQFDENILRNIILGIALLFIFFFLYIIFRKGPNEPTLQAAGTSHQFFTQELIIDQKGPSWRERAREFFRPYSGKEEDPIRKEYRNLLKSMRKAGIWKNDSMTIEQLNQLNQNLYPSSYLYQKVRYGDQTLTDEEIHQFKKELHLVLEQMNKLNKEQEHKNG